MSDLLPLLQSLEATVLAGMVAIPLAVALGRLGAARAAALAAVLLLPALLPLPGAGTVVAGAAVVLPFVALPAGWGLRLVPAGTLRIAESLAGPAGVLRRIWLPLAGPWLLAGLELGFARALTDAGLVWPGALLFVACAWVLLRMFAVPGR